MKRMGLLFCVFVCIAGFVAAQTEADFDTKAEGSGVVITGYKGKGGDVAIPATIGGKAVVGIGDNAFSESYGLASITIPASITSIGSCAFLYCTDLTSITIPASVTSIDGSAFYGCDKLEPEIRVDIVERFGQTPFYDPWM
jgi:hypothetical protein